jgi:hypothetical protein
LPGPVWTLRDVFRQGPQNEPSRVLSVLWILAWSVVAALPVKYRGETTLGSGPHGGAGRVAWADGARRGTTRPQLHWLVTQSLQD